MKKCCFTGHRCQKLPWGFNEKDIRYYKTKKDVREKIETLIGKGYTYFLNGMAIGFDMMAAEIVLEMKLKHPKVFLECVLPCKNQEIRWNIYQQSRYREILSKADKTTCLSEKYTDRCMLDRNEYMVNNSDCVIALYNGKGGGTLQTINYAKKLDKEVFIIKPHEN